MHIIKIANSSTHKDLEEFKRIFGALSSPQNVNIAQVNYTSSIREPDSDPTEFPLVIRTIDGNMFCILNVTADYDDEGPRGMCEILEACGFRFDRDLILENSGDQPVSFTLEKTFFGTTYKPCKTKIPHLSI